MAQVQQVKAPICYYELFSVSFYPGSPVRKLVPGKEFVSKIHTVFWQTLLPVGKGPLSVINTHHATKKINNAHICQADLPHLLSDASLRGIMQQRLENVSIGACVSTKNPTQPRYE